MSRIRVYSVLSDGYVERDTVERTESEWRDILPADVFSIMRKKGTERAFTGSSTGEGIYRCAACGNDLFTSTAKYDSGTGWPSFRSPVAPDNIKRMPDTSLAAVRTEVLCSLCGSHLGHVFSDGPPPEGHRYCINSLSLKFYEINISPGL